MKKHRTRFERGEFAHLTKGRMYKLIKRETLIPNLKSPLIYIWKTAAFKDQIGVVVGNPVVIYLDTTIGEVLTPGYAFLKVVINDQVGYIDCNQDTYRLQRITLRMLRRAQLNEAS